MNKRGDEPRSLLHRLLKQADERAAEAASVPHRLPGTQTKEAVSGVSGRAVSGSSPVRPASTQATALPSPLAPQTRNVQNIPIPQQITGVEERLQAEEALEQLRQKTAQIANEFAEGKLNRAQFTAMYASYNERRVIIERLLARDPGTLAWQPVARPGHTSFLRQHFEARVLSYAIYSHGSDDPGQPLTSQGPMPLSPQTIKPILTALNVMLQTHTGDRPLSSLRKPVDGGRWITIVPGKHTTAIALFSLEPSAQQFTRVQDLHRDFERANHVALERGIRLPDQLVFPHRALFEKSGE